MNSPNCQNLRLVFGDQLNLDSALWDDWKNGDVVWMAESRAEASHVWSSKQRIAVFFAAMRHFAKQLKTEGKLLEYHRVGDGESTMGELLSAAIQRHRPQKVVAVLPGEWRVRTGVERICREEQVQLSWLEDRHFFSTPAEFAGWAEGRNSIRLEYFYRHLRKKTGILMNPDGKPAGGDWNFDKDNRGSFGKEGPEISSRPQGIPSDELTRAVLKDVEHHFPDHPGTLDWFGWPVNRKEALEALEEFMNERLHRFGDYQDAMWVDEPFLFHSRISSALNLKLLNPREVVDRAERAYREGDAPINAVEGFVRQILGWREYVRGIYWWKMPEYLQQNALGAKMPLPEFFWTGRTGYRCLAESIGQTLKFGYAHHIQRLMVTGLYCLLLGVDPREVHEWYLAVYVDAVEWVELPNSLGMSQFADHGLMASKPYVASGKYIQRMSNYCANCPKNPAMAVGKDACPFTTLYWDFLARHRETLKANNRMRMQLKNLDRMEQGQLAKIRQQAMEVRKNPEGGEGCG